MTRARDLADSADKDFAGTVTVDNIVVDTDLKFATGATVTTILDEDAMGTNSATALATQQSIKAYVDTQVATVPTGDITEVTAGTGLSGGGTTGAVTLNIDSTVATLTGTQTLTNKTIDSSQLTGTLPNATFPAILPAVSGANLTGIQAGAGYFDGNNGATGDTTNGKGDIFRVHAQTLTSNVTIGSTDNALAVGPLTIDSSVTLTVNGNLTVA